MTLPDEINQAVKMNNAVIGYRESIKFLKTDKPQKIIVASNIPESMRKEIEHNSKVSGASLEVFSGSSKDLGVVCGKPFPIAVLILK